MDFAMLCVHWDKFWMVMVVMFFLETLNSTTFAFIDSSSLFCSHICSWSLAKSTYCIIISVILYQVMM